MAVEENSCRCYVRVVIAPVKGFGRRVVLCFPGARQGDGWMRLAESTQAATIPVTEGGSAVAYGGAEKVGR